MKRKKLWLSVVIAAMLVCAVAGIAGCSKKDVEGLYKPANLTYDGARLTWDKVTLAEHYTVQINGGEEKRVNTNLFTYDAKGEEFDATVNAVLTTKENQLKRCGIQLAYTIDIQKELPFDPTDICALFANALDNAAEACRKAENEDKKITLESRVQKGLFCLKITNPVGGDANEIKYHASKINLTTRDGSAPATTKPDKASHGLGLKSMREIVLRYQGEMELKSENGTAELFLYMPLCNG